MEKKERNKRILLGIVVGITTALLITGVTAGVYAQRMLNVSTIYPHVTVEGIDVHDLEPEEAKIRLEAHLETQLEDRFLTLEFEENEWRIPYKSLGFHYFYEEVLDEAMGFGRQGNLMSRLNDIKSLREQPIHLTLRFGYDERQLEKMVKDIEEELFMSPYPATIQRVATGFMVEPEQLGRELDHQHAIELAHRVLMGEEEGPITLVTNDISVYPTASDLNQIETVISEFSTTFNAGDIGRTANLRQGSNSIDGILLLPDQEFSFNDTTGPRIASAGYQEAPVILMGELVPGIGGGICQVSTTLYNAVVRADLAIVERTNHSLPVSYVPRGQDATVAFNSLDFKFKNNLQTPIFLESEVRGNQLQVRIFGKDEARPDIDLVSQVVQVIEPTVEIRYDNAMYEDEKRVEREAKTGYRVVTYKVYSENGREVRREEFNRDYYRPVNGIVIQGTRTRQHGDWLFNNPIPVPDVLENNELEEVNG